MPCFAALSSAVWDHMLSGCRHSKHESMGGKAPHSATAQYCDVAIQIHLLAALGRSGGIFLGFTEVDMWPISEVLD